MIIVISPRLAGPLATALGLLDRFYTHPDPKARSDLKELQRVLTQTANSGRKDAPFDSADIVAQAGGMKPLAVTYQVAGDLLSVDPRTIQRLVRNNELVAIGEGRGARVVMASIEAYVTRAAASVKAAS